MPRNVNNFIMVSPNKKLKLKMTPKVNKTGVGGAPAVTRKRHRSEYHQVEDDIGFLVTAKKTKLDTSSEDCDAKPLKEIKVKSEAVTVKAKNLKIDIAKANEQNKENATKDSEDNREFSRRSPNGFLLPDPLPRGEVLTDTIKQQWILGKAIGVGGFGELYLAAYRSADGKISPEKFVIKVDDSLNKLILA